MMSELRIPHDEAAYAKLNDRFAKIDGLALRKLAQSGLAWLRANQQVVNALNVFPVPDGDTGTNMVLTLQSAVDEISSLGDRSIGEVAHAIAHGALMGARGNSGVILSQLWRGFARSLDEKEVMDAASLAAALRESQVTAYKGVVKPVEGTILTVSKDIAIAAEKAIESGTDSAFDLLQIVVDAADVSVQRTPELLPVLKEAGVVDSGGKGLFYILEGMLRSAYGQPLDKAEAEVRPLSMLDLEGASEAIEPGQDWEVVIDFHPEGTLDLQSFYAELENLGTSIQVGEGDGMYRMHIHVPDKTEYEPIEYVRQLGTITNVAIENLMVQTGQAQTPSVSQVRLEPVDPGQIAVIAVAPGLGLARVFASLGVAAVIEGGQTMNPSTQEILASFENLPTDQVILLPNNKNIILAAKQATELTVKQVAVIPSVSAPQGIAALFAYEREGDFDEITQAMEAALTDIDTIEITTATRSVEIDDVDVQEGQSIALLNGRLAVAGDSIQDVLLESLEQVDLKQAELVTFYVGEDLQSNQANRLKDMVRERWDHLEIEMHEGGQPHYQLIISVE
jgi:DAK2 domain fusion protein YloV